MRDGKRVQTLYLDEEDQSLVVLDQTLLPGEIRYRHLRDAASVADAIGRLCVRGAPAIGVAAALGLYASAWTFRNEDDFAARLQEAAATIEAARPTAVNLSWAVARMRRAVQGLSGAQACLDALKAEAKRMYEEDRETNRRIGRFGAALLGDGFGVATHCNAGRLATVDFGTALAPLYEAKEQGKRLRVYVDETRPLLQGARLTAFELLASGLDVTLQCDGMAASAMQQGLVQAVLVGADRIAANGDTANKIGTLPLVICARHFGVPFYVCAPFSTIDQACADGSHIPVEERDGSEITDLWYAKPMAPKGVKTRNPAFDVTPAGLISALVTERGVLYPPFDLRTRG